MRTKGKSTNSHIMIILILSSVVSYYTNKIISWTISCSSWTIIQTPCTHTDRQYWVPTGMTWVQTLLRKVLLQVNLSRLTHLLGKFPCCDITAASQVTFRSDAVTRKTGHQGGSIFLCNCWGTTACGHSIHSVPYQYWHCVWCICQFLYY